MTSSAPNAGAGSAFSFVETLPITRAPRRRAGRAPPPCRVSERGGSPSRGSRVRRTGGRGWLSRFPPVRQGAHRQGGQGQAGAMPPCPTSGGKHGAESDLPFAQPLQDLVGVFQRMPLHQRRDPVVGGKPRSEEHTPR